MIRVLVAGIAGASLGTEVAKSLRAATGYYLVGCDISTLAYGHYGGLFDRTVRVDANRYIDDLLDLCRRFEIAAVVPGGDQPARLIAEQAARFRQAGIALAMNDPDVVARLADKASCFVELERLGFATPQTIDLAAGDCIDRAPLPCIVKPSNESGGSAFVFFARSHGEVELYASYMRNNNLRPIAQEYIPHDRGEFTVGVLSTPEKVIVGSIALKRVFPAKLSVSTRGTDFLISSGYSQGRIDVYAEICSVARAIAEKVQSRGPLNIQGRIGKDGTFLPFEINPRFSASTYLRTLAGFNEIDWYIRHLLGLPDKPALEIRPGWYLRSLTEAFVADRDMLQ